jgi:hypothetical protein
MNDVLGTIFTRTFGTAVALLGVASALGKSGDQPADTAATKAAFEEGLRAFWERLTPKTKAPRKLLAFHAYPPNAKDHYSCIRFSSKEGRRSD